MGLFGKKKSPEEIEEDSYNWHLMNGQGERMNREEFHARYNSDEDEKFEGEMSGAKNCNCCKCNNCGLEHNHWTHD